MRRRISAILLGTAALAVAAAFAAPVASAADPVGGCPTGDSWRLEPIAAVIPELDNGDYTDENGDGWGCAFTNRGQSMKHESSSWTWKDNTNPLPEV
jgi:hypothetical protein